MEIINANRNNLASVLMGKNIQFPWRGQNDIIINVPYTEWLVFVKKYLPMLQYRKPLDYERMLQSTDEGMKVRYFLYDISWALYSELACSSNVNKESTLILPYFDNGKSISWNEVFSVVNQMSDADVTHWHNSLKAVTRNYYGLLEDADTQYGLVDLSKLSDWNFMVFQLCIYLQSRSSNKIPTERINIDWRIS